MKHYYISLSEAIGYFNKCIEHNQILMYYLLLFELPNYPLSVIKILPIDLLSEEHIEGKSVKY